MKYKNTWIIGVMRESGWMITLLAMILGHKIKICSDLWTNTVIYLLANKMWCSGHVRL